MMQDVFHDQTVFNAGGSYAGASTSFITSSSFIDPYGDPFYKGRMTNRSLFIGLREGVIPFFCSDKSSFQVMISPCANPAPYCGRGALRFLGIT
jgi:hypothetical protein